MLDQIRHELERVVGASGVKVEWQDCEDGQRLVRIETAESICGMRPQRLVTLLKSLPDKAGILALRQTIDSHPDKVSLDDCSIIRQENAPRSASTA